MARMDQQGMIIKLLESVKYFLKTLLPHTRQMHRENNLAIIWTRAGTNNVYGISLLSDLNDLVLNLKTGWRRMRHAVRNHKRE